MCDEGLEQFIRGIECALIGSQDERFRVITEEITACDLKMPWSMEDGSIRAETCRRPRRPAGQCSGDLAILHRNNSLTGHVMTNLRQHNLSCLRVATIVVTVVVLHFGIAAPAHSQFSSRSFSAGDKNRLAEAERLSDEFMKLYRAGKYREALVPAKRVVTIREEVLGPNHPKVASSLSNLGSTYNNLDDFAAAESVHVRALKIREQSRGPNHADTADSVNALGVLYYNQAKFAEAELHFRRALAIQENTLGPQHTETATTLNNLAMIHRKQGNYAAAEPLFKRALAIQEKASGRNDPETATSLNNLASVHFLQGNYAAAEPLYLRALRIRESTLPPDHPDLATTLNDLAFLYNDQQRYDDAEPLYKRALEIYEKLLGPNHSYTASAVGNLAALYHTQGNYAAAEPLHLRALSIRQETLGRDHPKVAVSANNLAELYRIQRKYDVAEPLYLQALDIQQQSLGPDHPDTTRSLHNLAGLLAAKGDYAEAGRRTDLARRGARNHVTRVLPALSEQEQALFLAVHYESDLHRSLSLGLARPEDQDLRRKSASWAINGKAVAMEALAQRNVLARDVSNPRLAPVVKQLLVVREQLAEFAMTTSGPDEEVSRQERIEQLTDDEQQLANEIAAAGDGTEVSPVNWIELDQVQAALPRGSAFVDIARFDVYDFSTEDNSERWQPARYAAWILHSDEARQTALIDLGSAEEIDALVEAVRRSLQNAPDRIRTEGEERASGAVQKELKALATRIWKPLESHLVGVEQIALSPDGMLWLVPWNSLPVGDTADEFLLEKHTLRFIISGRDIVTRPGQFVTQPPVILANPRFDQPASEKRSSIWAIFKNLLPEDAETIRDFAAKSLLGKVSALPNTGIEAIAIQPHLEKYAGQKAVLYKEQYALERVAKALRRPKVASFATHGFFLPTQEANGDNRDQMSSDATRSIALDTSGTPIENPLLRCGLLLSGCNNRESVIGDDDGILTGLEIVGIDLRGTELVVLSACETGVGEVQNGEGVAGLRQAFQLAGAQSVVSTLWQVPDRDSALIMRDFFANLAAGQSRAEALRAAQISRIESRRKRYGAAHPFYWAAWTMTGQ